MLRAYVQHDLAARTVAVAQHLVGLLAPEGCDYDFPAARTPDQVTFREPVIGRS